MRGCAVADAGSPTSINNECVPSSSSSSLGGDAVLTRSRRLQSASSSHTKLTCHGSFKRQSTFSPLIKIQATCTILYRPNDMEKSAGITQDVTEKRHIRRKV